MILRIEHLIGAGESRTLKCLYMKLSYGHYTLKHIRITVRVRLMEHSFISRSGRPRLIGVYPWHDHYLIFYLILYLPKPRDVFQYGIRPVRGAGSYHKDELTAPSEQSLLYSRIILPLFCHRLVRQGIHLFYDPCGRQFPLKLQIHFIPHSRDHTSFPSKRNV